MSRLPGTRVFFDLFCDAYWSLRTVFRVGWALDAAVEILVYVDDFLMVFVHDHHVALAEAAMAAIDAFSR